MQTIFNIFVVFLSLLAFACSKKKSAKDSVNPAETLAPLTESERTSEGVSSTTENVSLDSRSGAVIVGKGAFSVVSEIEIVEVSAASFSTITGLSANEVKGVLGFSATSQSSGDPVEPTSGIEAVVFAGATAPSESTVGIVLVTDADASVRIFYLPYSSLAVNQNTAGEYEVSFGPIVSGNFTVALLTGQSLTTLARKYKVKPETGIVSKSLSIPTQAAVSLAFTDSDTDGGYISGSLEITGASTLDFLYYVGYWGSSSNIKLNSTPIFEEEAGDGSVSVNVLANTAIPSGATHFLVFSRNGNGEMTSGIALAIVDIGVPVHAPVSISFTDTDTDGGQVSGNILLTRAANESDITHYVFYWGSSSSTKQNATPIATVAVTGSNISQPISANTAIPTSPIATHILAFAKNDGGEMATGVSEAIVDSGVPQNAAHEVSFTDSDTDGGQISGNATITRALDESDVTHYVLYWGSNSTTKQSGTPIATIAVTGSNVTHTFGANTSIPTGPAATHLLVFTKNGGGEMATGVSVSIVDVGVPVNQAANVSFTDTDLDGGQLGGSVSITNAISESDLTHYVLYWGSNSSTKQSGTAIAQIAKTGSPLTYNFSANTSIPSGPTATHLLVYTKNADGEMATGINVALTDLGVPVNAAGGVAFTDSDTTAGEISGTVTITKASSESDLTHYVLYWGSNSSTKQNGTPISSIAKTGSNVTYNFSADTSIPSSPAATHLLVFTKNADGEMGSGVNVGITDNTGGGCGGGTVSVGGFCWAKSSFNQSCTAKCTALGGSYNTATSTYAGLSGSLAQCKAVIDAIEGGNNSVSDDSENCNNRVGCNENGPGNFIRCTDLSPTGTATDPSSARFCACTI